MNLKLVVAMSILGLVSCPVFAATETEQSTEQQTTTSSKPHHHKHHHKHKVKHVEEVAPDYKGMGALAPEVCTISQTSMIMNRMTQSAADITSEGWGRAMPSPCRPGWFNRVQFAGGINVDLGKFGNRNANFMGVNYQRFSLNDVYLNMAAVINDWTKAFASISYNTATINAPLADELVGEYSSAYSNNVSGSSNNALQIEQAYITFANFDMSPVFAQVGKQFQDYGRYEIHPITRSMTQVLTETLATSAKLGFIASGFNGSIYAFDDPIAKVGQTSKPTNYGAALGYDAPSDYIGWDIGLAYLYNMIGVNDVAYVVNQFNGAGVGIGGYNSRVAAGAIYADLNSGPFVVGVRYTTALQRFSILDLPKNGLATNPDGTLSSTTGGKPWAAGIQGNYGFNAWGKDQNVYLGYQASREAGGLLLPKYRWLVGYGIELFGKDTDVGLEWDHDKSYSNSNGGNGNSYNLVSLRLAAKFG